MNRENLEHFEPDECQYEKFKRINAMSDEQWELACVNCNDCSICDMAIHQFLISTTRHVCVRDMSEKEFEIAMDNADCSF